MKLHFAAKSGSVSYDGITWPIIDGVAEVDHPDAIREFMESHGASDAADTVVAQVSIPATRQDMLDWLRSRGVMVSVTLSNAKLAELVADHSSREAAAAVKDANDAPLPAPDYDPDADPLRRPPPTPIAGAGEGDGTGGPSTSTSTFSQGPDQIVQTDRPTPAPLAPETPTPGTESETAPGSAGITDIGDKEKPPVERVPPASIT